MEDTITEFKWSVTETGYRWVKGESIKGFEDWYLTDGIGIGAEYRFAEYVPDGGLFRTFADLSPSKSAILKFANKYGLLTGAAVILTKEIAHPVGGVNLQFWTYQIQALAQGVRLWELAKTGDVRRLASLLRWKGTEAVHYHDPVIGGGAWIDAHISPELIKSAVSRDLIKPAWFHLRRIVNERLKAGISERLLWDQRHHHLSLYNVPSDLVAAMWHQFARAIEARGGHERQYRPCDECQNWFEVASPDGGRSDKRYCGTACRARAWRRNHGER
jgi:hypothetical protein